MTGIVGAAGVYGAGGYGLGTYGIGSPWGPAVAIGDCWWQGVLAFTSGTPIPATHPGLEGWIREGVAASTSAPSSRYMPARLGLGLRTRAVSPTCIRVPPAPPFGVAGWSQSAVTTGSATVAKPTGTGVGDVLIGIHTCDPDGSPSGLGAPDGSWSQAGVTGSSPAGHGRVWVHPVTSEDEPASYTFTGPTGGPAILAADVFPGSSSQPWSSTWLTGQAYAGSYAVQVDGYGLLGAGSIGSYGGRRTQRVSLSARSDFDLEFVVRFDTTRPILHAMVRGDSSDDLRYGYGVRVEVGTTNNVIMYRQNNYAQVPLGTASVTVAEWTRMRVKIRLQGSDVRCKVWADGTAEPGSWLLTATDGAYTTPGYALVGIVGGSVPWAQAYIDDMTLRDPAASGASPEHVVTLLRVTGAKQSNPLLVSPTWGSASGATTSHVASSVSPTAQTVLVTAWQGTAPALWTIPASMTPAGAVSGTGLSRAVAFEDIAAAGATGTRTATSSASSPDGSLTVALAVRQDGPDAPPPAGGMPARVAGEVWHTWCPPNLAEWPADVIGTGSTPGLCNHVVALIGQTAQPGTGRVQWGPGDGTSAAAATATIGALRTRDVNVILAVGGADLGGGIRLTTSGHVTEMTDTVGALVSQYGFNGIELWMKANWSQAQVVALYAALKAAHGSTWVNGLWVDLYPPLTDPWLALIDALGSDLDYVTLHLHDFPECRDSRLTTETLRKLEVLTGSGWPASKTLLFFMTTPPARNWPNSSPVGVTRAAWIAALQEYPDLLGAVHYESRIEGGSSPSWPWMRDVGALVRS